MCRGFGAIITKNLDLYFCEPDTDGDVSHSEILRRLQMPDSTNEHLRKFVRIQCPDWKVGSFEFDEERSLPAWADDGRDDIITLVQKTLVKCAPSWAEYEKVCGAALAKMVKRMSNIKGYVHKVTK